MEAFAVFGINEFLGLLVAWFGIWLVIVL